MRLYPPATHHPPPATWYNRAAMTTIALLQKSTSRHRAFYLEALRDLEGITAVALVDEEGGTVAEARRILGDKPLRTYESFQAMRAAEDPALAIATFTSAETPAALQPVLESSIPVLVEKPACVELDQFARLVDLADQTRIWQERTRDWTFRRATSV